MIRQYIKKRFSTDSLNIIAQANSIVKDYQEQGFSLTLRQLYYQFVSRDIIANTQKEYKRLGSIINDARLAGHIDWSAIEDRTRAMQKNTHWGSPEDILRSVYQQFSFDRRQDQPYYVEVWIEKDALSGVISGICSELDVPYFSCRGYTSQSEMHAAAMRFVRYDRGDRQGVVIHLGDHDPSGIDMTRDISERLNLFYSSHCDGYIDVRRVALSMDQVVQYDPPPNPAKSTDSRFQDYQRTYGNESWELDALEPSVIVDLVRDNVMRITDRSLLYNQVKAEEKEKLKLMYIYSHYESITTSEKAKNFFEKHNGPGA